MGKTVGVPRGLLRFLVLKMLSEKPMSGAEIAEQIESQTEGHWKPSPGSIYPLLAWLLGRGFTRESPKGDEGFKRYIFTVEGSNFLKKQIELGQDFLHKMEFLLPILVGGLQLESGEKKLRAAIEPSVQLVSTLTSIRHNLDYLSQEDIEEIVKALNDCSKKLKKFICRPRSDGETKLDNLRL